MASEADFWGNQSEKIGLLNQSQQHMHGSITIQRYASQKYDEEITVKIDIKFVVITRLLK